MSLHGLEHKEKKILIFENYILSICYAMSSVEDIRTLKSPALKK